MGPADVRQINSELAGCLWWILVVGIVGLGLLLLGAFFLGRWTAGAG